MTPHVPKRNPAGNIRKIYAVAGIVLALMWLGETNEPAWAHGLRTVVLLLILPPLLLPTNRRLTAAFHTARYPARALTRLIAARILIVTAALTVNALLGHLLDPHSDHHFRALAVRVMCVLLTIPLQVRAAHRARGRGAPPPSHPTLSAPRLMCAKLALVVTALLAQLLLDPYVANAQLMIAAALAVTVTAWGPKIHTRLLTTSATPIPARAMT
ncbi:MULTISPECIES: hypothetical protein [unclassified Streptomyces]|uniref:hypothetical protein n=1 Tax=unclassified Streptomyces TaxID=2593676 RepID=UPI0003614D7B|nr:MULTISPECIES: hypothetical protein [unclassified Streptomyces]MYT33121.1 hypothetical protein [Streptomyces sp. SID8354]